MPRNNDQRNKNQRPTSGTNNRAGNSTRRQKRKSNANKRSNNNNNGGHGGEPNVTAVRTPDTIIRQLARKTAQMVLNGGMDDYSCCRLLGTIPRSIPSIPDGSSGKHICVCLYSLDRINLTGATAPGQLVLQLQAWVPLNLTAVCTTSAFALNGNTYNAGVIAPGGVAPEFQISQAQTTPGWTSSALDVYGATAMRIISLTSKITYTGPVHTCSGAIRIYENHMSLNPAFQTTSTSSTSTAPTTGIALNIYNGSGASTAYAPVNTPVLTIDGASVGAIVPPMHQSWRPEAGVIVRCKHRTNKFESVPVAVTPLGMTAATPTTLGNNRVFNSYTATSSNYGGGILGFDNDWTGVTVLLDGINADSSYTVETMCCVEFQPSVGSPYYKLTKESPSANPSSIRKVDATLRSEGVARQRV